MRTRTPRHLLSILLILGLLFSTGIVGCSLCSLLEGFPQVWEEGPAEEREERPPEEPSPAPTRPVGEPVIDKWGLWVGGTHLRGANIYQRRVYPELDGTTFAGPGPVGPPYTQDDFDRLAALGANYVNISHPGLFSETPPHALDQGIQDNLDKLLDMITQANMFAVISFRTGPGRSEFTFFLDEVGDWFDESYLNDSVWQDQAAQDGWVAMWRYTAERYRDNPIVVGYDLMVEPNANEVWLDIWDPEEFYETYADTLYDWNQLYPRITAAIRDVDPNTPILVGGMSYSAVEWLPHLEPTGDERTVYMVHQYEPVQYTHQWPPLQNTYPGVFDTDWDGVEDQFDRAWLDDLLSTVDDFVATHGVPVAVNEFGIVRWEPGAPNFMHDQMDLFEQRGMDHALWMWEVSWDEYAEQIDAFNFRHGPDPDHHSDVTSSDLIDVIVAYWERNTLRPSNITEEPVATRPDGAVRLTDPPLGTSDQNPAFSPNGTRLLFTRFESGYNAGPSALYLLEFAGGNVPAYPQRTVRLLTDAPDSDNVNLPGSCWNAATDHITFASDRKDIDEVWIIAPDGSDLSRVTHHTTRAHFIEPSFSPNGQWIVFEADTEAPEDLQQGSIWKVSADGTELTQLTDGPGGGTDDRQPNWSPSGDRIVFQRRTPGSDDWNLYTMAPDGSDVRPVTTAPASDTDASWSPDGHWIVYSSDYGRLPTGNIFIVSAQGGMPLRVTDDDTREDSAPSWSPDAQWIAFESRLAQHEDMPAALWVVAAPATRYTAASPLANLRGSGDPLASPELWHNR